MRFRVTNHSGHNAPADAVDRLWGAWPARLADARADRRAQDILIVYGHREGRSELRPEQVERERLEVLDLIREVCEGHRGLKLEWYAVAPEP